MLQSVFRSLLLIAGGLFVSAAAAADLQTNKQIFGLHEQIYLFEIATGIKAKLDTGATTSSLSARNIKRFKRKGESWVRFQLAWDGASDQVFELPLARVARIKLRADELTLDDEDEQARTSAPRPVVNLTLHLADRQQQIEVNLVDRSTFKYSFLLGARGLKALGAVVDPSLSLTAGRPQH